MLAVVGACGQASEPEPEPVASDGIQVHGHWTVTVTNPDGTLDAVHEFDNALSDDGLLSSLLAGENKIDQHAFILRAEHFICIEQFSVIPYATESVKWQYLDANVFVADEPYRPLMLSAYCTVEKLAGTDTKTTSLQLTDVKTLFYDLDSCMTRYISSKNKVECNTHNSSVHPEWGYDGVANGYQKGVAELTAKENMGLIVKDGQYLAINVDISFS